MSTYAQVSDFQSYTELTIATQSGGLQALLDQAERDIDKIISGDGNLTDAIMGISFSNVTGGTFRAGINWGLYSYDSDDIPWNTDGDTFLDYLDGMTGSGMLLPANSWQIPETTFSDQAYAYGPLPGTPIVFQADGELGAQVLPLITVDTSMLEGDDATALVAQLVGGGLKVDPNQLAPSDAMALKRAVCAQAEYRDQMGPAFFVMPQFKTVSGPEFNTSGRRPRIGPRVMDELASTDLIQRGARARISTSANRAIAYMPVGGLGIPDDWRAI